MSVYIYRLSQWLEKKFNAKGGNVITDLDNSARAVLPLSIGVEERYLQGWNRFSVVTVCGAAASVFSRFRIRNPPGSNVICVVEQLQCFTTGATADSPFVTWGATVSDLLNLVPLTFTRMDPRGNPQPTSIVSFNQQAAGGAALMQRAMLTNTNVDWINSTDQQITNLPGQAIDIQANVANQQLIVTCMWRERSLELSELT